MKRFWTKVFLDESVFGRKCFWTSFFFCKLDESVPNHLHRLLHLRLVNALHLRNFHSFLNSVDCGNLALLHDWDIDDSVDERT